MRFKTKADMSALQALEVREADDFTSHFPVLSSFRRSLLLTHLLSIDPDSFQGQLENAERSTEFKRGTAGCVSAYDPYEPLKQLESEKTLWSEYSSWLKRLADIDKLSLIQSEKKAGTDEGKYIFPHQHGQLIFARELSTGATLIVAILTAIFTFLRQGGALLIEEPETRLHPRAIIDLISLFRDVARDRSIIFSTHSPVAINSLKPSEVTVMKFVEKGFVTTQAVSEIKEAIDALNRDFLSFGDLLQLNFSPEADGSLN
jgi:hypothetical protein